MAQKLYTPLIDFIFKRIFGDQRNIHILTAFLQAVLTLPREEYSRLQIVDPHLKREYGDDKLGILDVKVITKSNYVINVEIQMSTTAVFRKRLLWYMAKLLTEQIRRGENYQKIEWAICIAILGDTLMPENGDYHNEMGIINKKTGEVFTDLMELHTIELSKLPAEPDGSKLWNWGRFLTSKTPEEFEMAGTTDADIGEAVAVMFELNEDDRQRMLADARQAWLWDQQAREDERYRQALLETARRLKARGVPVSQIAEDTGLSPEDLAGL
jgi:predicted transposase/invertase (TIGR01784 family)